MRKLFLFLVLSLSSAGTHAQPGSYIVAFGDQGKFGGMVYYEITDGGVLDGGFFLDADPSLHNPETATPRAPGANALDGVYDVQGSVLGKAYTGSLTLEMLAGKDTSGIYRLTWDDDDRGLAFHVGAALIGGFSSDGGGTLRSNPGAPIELSLLRMQGDVLGGQELVLDGEQLEGEHRATDKRDPDAPPITISIRRDGDLYRIDMPNGRVGIAMPLEAPGE